MPPEENQTIIGEEPPVETPKEEAPPPAKEPSTAGEGGEAPKDQPTDAPKEEPPKEEPKEGPIDYKPFTLPEGVTVDDDLMGKFKEFAAETRLSQEAAQKIVTLHAEAAQKAKTSFEKDLTDHWESVKKEWTREVESDEEIGGNNLASVKATVAKALDQYGEKGVRNVLNLTGAGNNPAIIKTLYRMAKALTENTGGPTGSPTKGSKSAAQTLYPDLPSGA